MTVFGSVERKAVEEEVPYESYQNIRTLRFSSARSVARLMEIHRASWGVDRIPAGNIQWIKVAQSTLLEGLDDPENRHSFYGLLIATKAFARRWILEMECSAPFR